MDPHIIKIYKNISRFISISYKVKSLIQNWLKLQLYYSLVHYHLNYRSLVWKSTTRTSLERLFYHAKKAVRCLDNLNCMNHSALYFLKHKLLNVNQMFHLILSIYIRHDIFNDQMTFFRDSFGIILNMI